MSDKANKARPKIERIARLEGSTTFRDPREGFGISTKVQLSDQDIASAIAMSRRRRDDGTPDPDDVGPECLETYYGSTQTHRRLLVYAYMRAHHRPAMPLEIKIRRRMAATLGVQMLAGMTFTRAQWAEFAYLSCCRRDEIEDSARAALRWFNDQAHEAKHEFGKALQATAEVLLAAKEMGWQEQRSARDRDARIRGKLFKRNDAA